MNNKQFYEKYWNSRNKSSHRPRHNIFSGWIRDNSSVLDVGCGDGAFLNFLKEQNRGLNLTGVDISEQALSVARERGFEALQADVSSALPFKDKTFDYSVCSEVLEHIANSEDLLNEMRRISRKGVLVSVPNIALWKHRCRLFFLGSFPIQWLLEPREHIRFFSVKDFIKTTRALGFTVRKVKVSSGTRIFRYLWPNLFADQVCFLLE
ncbi:MAG: Methyltransferase type 12 [Candidatus Magasanikbacteria bacterium GW2011_GWA2_42_32]|uniref:Methyltransferase type 12 n=1 Tax=Candidatus Magasanikbacteria bacterium GW2011_GWA2_42_32 TaxID=1619039 RepID=A0A0G1C8X4_9BACT|nr:MAG: Methyltransferase type 12 [Candidatus Magasanikbacteria bacterium GW2011_GWA2_42_32]